MQVAPFAGYRFGDDPWVDEVSGDADVGDGVSIGGTLDMFFAPARSVTLLYSHSDRSVAAVTPTGAPTSFRVSFDHYLAGGTDEIAGTPRVRPFLTGAIGATNIRGGGDSEMRFTIAAGGGVKLLPARHLGIRADGRVYAIFAGGGTSAGFCGGYGCLIGLDVSVMWQAEFTAGLVFSF